MDAITDGFIINPTTGRKSILIRKFKDGGTQIGDNFYTKEELLSLKPCYPPTTKRIEELGFKKVSGKRRELMGDYLFTGEKGTLKLIINVRTCSLYVRSDAFPDESKFVFGFFYFQTVEDIKSYIWASQMEWGPLLCSTPEWCERPSKPCP